MKLSPNKSNLPGRKQLYRIVEDGTYVRDIISVHDEDISGAEPLLTRVMRSGKRTSEGERTVERARELAAKEVPKLPAYLSFNSDDERSYPVELSAKLEQRRDETRERLEQTVQA